MKAINIDYTGSFAATTLNEYFKDLFSRELAGIDAAEKNEEIWGNYNMIAVLEEYRECLEDALAQIENN